MAKPKIKKTITRKEWNKKHKDFKLMGKDGIPYIMAYDEKIGTHLIPVKITEGIAESVASEIDLIRQDSSDIRDFLKKVFSNSDFRDLKNDKDFIKYLKSIYEGIDTDTEMLEKKNPGLWANIRAKRARGEKPAHGNSQAHKDAVKAAKKINKKNESINEADDTYFNSFREAVEYARKSAEKRGFTIDEDDWQNQIAFGGRYTRSRPSKGKAHSFTVGLLKNGKPQRKALQISVYGMPSGRYELTHYIN